MKKTKKRNLTLIALFLIIIVLAITFIKRGHSYALQVYPSGEGWGYDILKNDKILIHQPFIPAMEGERPFANRRAARQTGRLVMKKIRGREFPSVTREELEKILNDTD